MEKTLLNYTINFSFEQAVLVCNVTVPQTELIDKILQSAPSLLDFRHTQQYNKKFNYMNQ